jgi:quercetin dioxygenase-like cupin family protein
MDDDDLGLPVLGDGPAPSFERRTVTIGPGQVLTYEEADWRGAIVVVVEGEVELECRAGARRRFPSGAVLWIDGLGLSALGNPGRAATVLVAISRRTDRVEHSTDDPIPPTAGRRLNHRDRIDRERPAQPRGAEAMSENQSSSSTETEMPDAGAEP